MWEGALKSWVERYDRGNGKRNPTSWNVSKWAGGVNYYTQMYAGRYWSALDVAGRLAREHAALLRRVLAWQGVIYSESTLPVWLRDGLVNNLYLLTEDSVWGQARPPLTDATYPEGAYALIESPRGDPALACIPCDWYGNLPIVYFFPELAHSTLKLYKHYQREDGAAPFWLGILGDTPDFVTTAYDWQISLNGTCYVDLVDRLWQRTGDDGVLREFYDSVKKCNTMTMNLRHDPGGVISMPTGNNGMEWFEHGEWAALFHGLPGVFDRYRVQTPLQTIKDCNVALTPKAGAANFSRPDGSPVSAQAKLAYYGTYAMFTPEVVVLGMTYIYAGKKEFGVELVRRHWEDLFLRQGLEWDTPNIVRGDTGARVFGTDYYQNMMLWALPLAMNGQDLKQGCGPGSHRRNGYLPQRDTNAAENALSRG